MVSNSKYRGELVMITTVRKWIIEPYFIIDQTPQPLPFIDYDQWKVEKRWIEFQMVMTNDLALVFTVIESRLRVIEDEIIQHNKKLLTVHYYPTTSNNKLLIYHLFESGHFREDYGKMFVGETFHSILANNESVTKVATVFVPYEAEKSEIGDFFPEYMEYLVAHPY